MKINQLLESKQELLEQRLTESRLILSESCVGLDREQRDIVEGIYKELLPLIEASLTPDQVQGIFGAVEKNVSASGGNRTLIGKGVDTAKQADEIINNLGRRLQDTKPVQAFDQKFEQLKVKVSQKFPDLSKKIESMGEWAKANPGKTAAIVGVMTAIAGLAGGPVGGAIAGQVLRGAAELLKGEKLSTAVGKGIKTAALGFISAKGLEMIGDALGSGLKAVADNMFPGARKLDYTNIVNEIGGKFGNRFATFELKGIVGQPGDISAVQGAANEAVAAWKEGNYQLAKELWHQAKDAAEVMASPEYVAQLTSDAENRKLLLSGAKGTMQLFDVLGSVAQGAAAASGMQKPQPKAESRYYQTRPLSEGQVYRVFNQVLDEGIWDKIKAGAGKVAGKAQAMGHNLANKVTADKLNSAWAKAGSPTDSDELAKFLAAQGIDAAVVAQVFKDMKLPPPGQGQQQPPAGGATPAQAQTLYAQVKADLSKLDKKGKQRIAAYLQKQLGVA